MPYKKVGYVYPNVTMHFISLKLLTFTDLLGMWIVMQIHPSPLPLTSIEFSSYGRIYQRLNIY